MAEVIVALDQGSSSSRALAFDVRGRELAKAQRPLWTLHTAHGRMEHDPDELLRGQKAALEELLRKLGRRKPKAIGLAAQRSTILFWDRKTGRPVGRALSWQDGRAGPITDALAERRAEAYEKTGLVLTPYYSAGKIAWALKNWPAVRRLADQGRLAVGPVTTFLVWHLTKGEVFAADPTMAQRTLLFNLGTMDWDADLLKWFGVPREALPMIRPSYGDWGRLAGSGDGAGIPIAAALGDQQSAVIGLGVRAPAEGVLNYGTGAFFLLNTGAEKPVVPGLLRSVALQKPGGSATFLLEGTVHAAGTSFDWLRENLGLLKSTSEVDKLCKLSAKGGKRVLSLNAIGGLGAPRWDYQTFAGLVGLTSQTGKEDVVRGVTEGIAFLIADIVQAIRGSGFGIQSVRCSGGLSRIDYLVQFQSELLQMPVARCAEKEATALGAAALAAEASGAAPLDSFPPAPAEKTFKPALKADDARRLLEGWSRFAQGMQGLSAELRKAGVLG